MLLYAVSVFEMDCKNQPDFDGDSEQTIQASIPLTLMKIPTRDASWISSCVPAVKRYLRITLRFYYDSSSASSLNR